MDGPSGGGGDNRGGGGGGGGSWRARKYDATNQIKHLLGVPTDDEDKPVVTAELRSPPQNIPRHRQGQLMNDYHNDRSGSPSNRHQRWENPRYQDGRHRNEGYGSPGRNHHRQYDQNRTPPHRYQDLRQRQDSYGSPSNHRGNSYDRGYNNSLRHPNMRDSGPHMREGIKDQVTRYVNVMSGCGLAGDVEAPDFRPSPEVLAELEEQFLYPLKKRSLKFPKAKYFCRLCDYHCDSLVVCRRHIMDNRHKKLKEAKDVDISLRNMPQPSDAQIAVIDRLINSIADEMRVYPEMMQQRRDAVTQLNDLLISKVEGCHLEMVGSSLSGFCLKTSDINIDVVMDDNLSPSTALLAVKELVGRNAIYKDVLDDLSSSFPTMAFTHVKTGLRMVVGACSTSSKLTNQLLGDYATLDPRVATLGIALRYWAQLCQVDNQGRGTLPPHVFALMVVHFLQQHQPAVLPVLHTLHPNPDGDVYLKPADIGDKWKPGSNTQNIGSLWLDMFRFYTVGFKVTEYVINVRLYQPMTRGEKTWNKKITVEDPFLQKRNLTRTVSGNPVFEYIVDRFKTTYRYFAIPQLSFGPLFHHIVVKEVGHSQSEGSSEGEMDKTDDDLDVTVEGEEFEDDEDPASFSGGEPDLSSLAIEDASDENDDTSTAPSTNGVAMQEEELQINLDKLTSPITLVTPSQAAKLISQVTEEHLNLKFDGETFRNGLEPPLICGSCQKDGHCKADCREDELPPLKPLPPMKPYFLNQLTAIFEKLTNEFEPCAEEIEERDRIVADLEFYIRQFFWGVTLKLFGSSANGFGFQHSDLDICLTFDGNPTGQDIDHIKVIESLAEKLKKYRQCGHVFAITTAKVPIVKFSIRRAALEGDLSLYNTLALQNTQLLSMYSKIDYRVKCLGYGMKYFAKLCDIGDASRGSLSSYAYILMVLHFLQQCKPPVIPVLQQLYDHSKPAPQLTIDGWNAWFFCDLKSLPTVWKDYGKNKDSIGHLWVSMLRYYTETFLWKEHVVTIRQHEPLTRLEKLWNSRCIAIEDPFDLSHNLGAGLSRKMNTFIMKAFIRGRQVFGSPISVNPGYRQLVDYLFDTKHLTDGSPPNDRGCRFCGKIGHIQRDCPKKKLNIERREKKERQKDRQEQRAMVEMKKDDAVKPDQKRLQENSHSDNVGKNGAGGSTRTTSKGTDIRRHLKMLKIPLELLLVHFSKWDSSLEYQKYGYDMLGLFRYLPTKSGMDDVFRNQSIIKLPTMESLEFPYKWVIDLDIVHATIEDNHCLEVGSGLEFYTFLLEECKMLFSAEPQMYDSEVSEDDSSSSSSNDEVSRDLCNVLREKMITVTSTRKSERRAKIKERYVRKARAKYASDRLEKKKNGPKNSHSDVPSGGGASGKVVVKKGELLDKKENGSKNHQSQVLSVGEASGKVIAKKGEVQISNSKHKKDKAKVELLIARMEDHNDSKKKSKLQDSNCKANKRDNTKKNDANVITKDYVLDNKYLTDESFPNDRDDRDCRFCGKIGHIQRDCPKKKLTIERREKKERQKDCQNRKQSQNVTVHDNKTAQASLLHTALKLEKDIKNLTIGDSSTEKSAVLKKKRALTKDKNLPQIFGGKTNEKVDLQGGSLSKCNIGKTGAIGLTHTTAKVTDMHRLLSVIKMLTIPADLLLKHCSKWDSSLEYRRYGYECFGLFRYLGSKTCIDVFSKQSMVMLPTLDNEEYPHKWVIDLDIVNRSIMNKSLLNMGKDVEFYQFLLERILQMLHPDPNQLASTETRGETADSTESRGETAVGKSTRSIKRALKKTLKKQNTPGSVCAVTNELDSPLSKVSKLGQASVEKNLENSVIGASGSSGGAASGSSGGAASGSSGGAAAGKGATSKKKKKKASEENPNNLPRPVFVETTAVNSLVEDRDDQEDNSDLLHTKAKKQRNRKPRQKKQQVPTEED